MFVVFAIAAVCLTAPVNGPVIAEYSPIGQYGGHWGIDYSAVLGTPVRAPASGLVTFAGSVAGMRSVTIQPLPGFKISMSYLLEIHVAKGDRVGEGEVVALSGVEDGVSGVHLSTRLDGRYIDPDPQMGCRSTDVKRALRLVTPPQPYPRSRANRNSGRDLRSDPYRSSSRGRNRFAPGRPRRGPIHSSGRSLAEAWSSDYRDRTPLRDDPFGHRQS